VLDDYDGGIATRVSQHHDWHDDGDVNRFSHRQRIRIWQRPRCSWSSVTHRERIPKRGILDAAMVSRTLHGGFGSVGATPRQSL
jgi:hypothetical protein